MRRLACMVMMVLVVGGCGTSSPATSEAGAAGTDNGDVAELRELALAYWEAFNDYRPDEVLALLEPGYRAEREETIRSEIDRIEMFGVRLGASEESAPVLVGADEGAMLIALEEPLGTRTITMRFARVEGEWKITFAGET